MTPTDPTPAPVPPALLATPRCAQIEEAARQFNAQTGGSSEGCFGEYEKIERDLNAANARLAEMERLTIQNKSNQELGDAIVEVARRLSGVIEKEKFSNFSAGESARIACRQLEEIGCEIRDPGVSKWGRPNAQEVWQNQHAKVVWHETQNKSLQSRLTALESQLNAITEAAKRTLKSLEWHLNFAPRATCDELIEHFLEGGEAITHLASLLPEGKKKETTP